MQDHEGAAALSEAEDENASLIGSTEITNRAMPDEQHERTILLNKMVSSPVAKAPNDVDVPSIPGKELLLFIKREVDANRCIEFYNSEDDDDFDKRLKLGAGKSSLSLDRIVIDEKAHATYVVLLFTKVDHKSTHFGVVDRFTRIGRHVTGKAEERGGHQCHIVIKLPGIDDYDDRSYRCAIEHVKQIPRDDIEHLLSKQIRRIAKTEDWRFQVLVKDRKSRPVQKNYHYYARLELLAEIGSNHSMQIQANEISHMVFVKRSEKQATASETEIKRKEYVADVEIRVTNSQGPEDAEEKREWLKGIKDWHELRGYTSKVYFKSARGTPVRGSASADMASATDLLFSMRKPITLNEDPTLLRTDPHPDKVAAMMSLLDDDSLWRAGPRG